MVFLGATEQNPIMMTAAVRLLREVPAAEVEVREGGKVFHLDCYRLYKRRRALPRLSQQS
jgi:hypothetical protein